jgi:hypothetical protein
MADDKGLKSSYELAMERLRKSDADAGIEERRLTEAQKAAIGEVRSFYQAKLAEQDILSKARLRQTVDPAEREPLEADVRRERERLVNERDAKIEKIRKAEDSAS